MTTLREYLTQNRLTLRAFSYVSDVDQSQLSRYINGKTVPTLENAYKIYRASKKAIKMEVWIDDKVKSKRY